MCDNAWEMVRFFGGALRAAGLVVLALGVSCGSPPPTPAPDIEATVTAAVRAALPPPTATPAPNIPATVQAGIRATLAARPTETPLPTPTATPRPTDMPRPTVTPRPQPTPTPSIAQMVERVKSGVVRIETAGGGGSGFVFETTAGDGSALVLTNYHVIEGYASVDVTVGDAVTYAGWVQGVDPRRDLAVVRICCGNFTALEFGDARDLGVGSEVVAVGYPLGLAGSATVTKGIVSANRFDDFDSRWEIQTDASINPGNSGGPLLAADGEVIGINTYIVRSYAGQQVVEGLGFAVSEVTVRERLPQLKAGRYVVTPTATPEPEPTRRVDWRRYEHPTWGYAFTAPRDWEIEVDEDTNVLVWGEGSSVFLRVLGPNRAEGSVEREAAAYFDSGRTSLNVVPGSVSVTKSSRGGIEKVRRDYLQGSSGEYCPLRAVQVAMKVGNLLYVLVGNACGDEASRGWYLVDLVVGSFDPPKWGEYRHPNYGYTVEIPPGWEHHLGKDDAVSIETPDGAGLFSIFGGYQGFASARELEEFHLDFLKPQDWTVFEAGRANSVRVGPKDTPGIRREYVLREDLQYCVEVLTSVAVLVDSVGYLLGGSFCEDSAEQYEPVIELILESFYP